MKQVNIKNENLLERIEGLEEEVGIALSRKKDFELEVENLKNILQETKKEKEAEATGIAYELKKLKELHARIGGIRMELCEKEKWHMRILWKSRTPLNLV